MITIEQPALGLNAATGHHVFVRMWNTGNVSATKPPNEIAEWIKLVALGAPGGKLKNVVLCCHGSPGQISLGTGIAIGDVPHFRRLATATGSLVDKFWIRACAVAQHNAGGGANDGHSFVQAFARATKSYVVVSTETQWSHGRTLPFGRIDGFEGLVLSYDPTGTISWQRRYRSGWRDSSGRGRYQTPD
ncbi:MAG: hypothetical protein AAF334_03240 [Pseudomonadota bacterium]